MSRHRDTEKISHEDHNDHNAWFPWGCRHATRETSIFLMSSIP